MYKSFGDVMRFIIRRFYQTGSGYMNKKLPYKALALIIVLFLTIRPELEARSLPASPTLSTQGIQVFFSPRAGSTEAIVQLIDNAQHTIQAASYSFTSAPIAKALLDAHKRGVNVRIVMDKSNKTARYSSATFFANQAMKVRINGRYAIMHSKYMVLDSKIVQTGSFNYTNAAEERNAENIMIIRDQPNVTKAYMANWEELWAESKDFKAVSPVSLKR